MKNDKKEVKPLSRDIIWLCCVEIWIIMYTLLSIVDVPSIITSLICALYAIILAYSYYTGVLFKSAEKLHLALLKLRKKPLPEKGFYDLHSRIPLQYVKGHFLLHTKEKNSIMDYSMNAGDFINVLYATAKKDETVATCIIQVSEQLLQDDRDKPKTLETDERETKNP